MPFTVSPRPRLSIGRRIDERHERAEAHRRVWKVLHHHADPSPSVEKALEDMVTAS
jgi:hypothetical protein